MRAIICLPLLAVLTVLPATAQDASHGFPLGKTFKAISISGFDVQKSGLTLTVSRNSGGDGLRGSGHAGCNGWSAGVILRDDQIDFASIVTTKKFCGRARMKAEEAFVTSLRSARRWRMDDGKLIIVGDAARLLLTPGAADKPQKKPAAKPRKRTAPRR
jgi:heat shock protein HslJ